jgi:hypothetical protein
MPLWSNTNLAASAPKFATKERNGGALPSYATGAANNHGNTVWGVPHSKAANTTAHGAHTGWVHVIKGTGPVTSITLTAPGTAYANTDTWKVSGATVNATGTIVTNGSGVITSAPVGVGGSGFTGTNGTLAITTSTGSGATLTPVYGGRANRVNYETLVAMDTISANAAGGEFTNLP